MKNVSFDLIRKRGRGRRREVKQNQSNPTPRTTHHEPQTRRSFAHSLAFCARTIILGPQWIYPIVGIGADRGLKHDPASVTKAQATLKAFLSVLEAHFAGNTYLAWGFRNVPWGAKVEGRIERKGKGEKSSLQRVRPCRVARVLLVSLVFFYGFSPCL